MSNLISLDYSDSVAAIDLLNWDAETLPQTQIQQQPIVYVYPLNSPQSVIEDGPLDKPALQNNKRALGRLLSNRRSISELVEQGIMPDASRVSPAHADRFRKLQRAQTSDRLRTKIQQRPARSSLVDQHILEHENPQVSPLLMERQKALKKSQLVDRLNTALWCRPGTLELVEKGVLPLDPRAQTLINDGSIHFTRVAEIFDQDQIQHQDASESQVTQASAMFDLNDQVGLATVQQDNSCRPSFFISDSFASPPPSVISAPSLCSIAPAPSCSSRDLTPRRQRISSNSVRARKTPASSNSYNIAGSGKQVEKFGNLVFHNFVPPSDTSSTKSTQRHQTISTSTTTTNHNNGFASHIVSLDTPSSTSSSLFLTSSSDAIFHQPYYVSSLQNDSAPAVALELTSNLTQTPAKVRECQQAEYLILQESTDIRSQLMSELTDEIRQRGSAVSSPPLYTQNHQLMSAMKVNAVHSAQAPPAAGSLPNSNSNPNGLRGSLERLTVPQLKAECRELGLLRYHKLNKRELLRLLEPHRAASLPTSPEASTTVSTATSPTQLFQPSLALSLSSNSSSMAAVSAAAAAAGGVASQLNNRQVVGPVLLTINSTNAGRQQSVEQVQHLNITADQLQALLHQLQLQEDEKQWRSKLMQLDELKQRLDEAERQVRNFLPTLLAHYSSVGATTSSETLQHQFQELTRCADDLRHQLASCYELDKCRLEKDFLTALSQSNGDAVQTLRERHVELEAVVQQRPRRERSQTQTELNDCRLSLTTQPSSSSSSYAERAADGSVFSSPQLQRSWTWNEPFAPVDVLKRETESENESDTLKLIEEILADETHLPTASPMIMDEMDCEYSPPNNISFNVKEATMTHTCSGFDQLVNCEELHEMLHQPPLVLHQPHYSSNFNSNCLSMELLTPCSQDVMFSDLNNFVGGGNGFCLMDTESDSIFAE